MGQELVLGLPIAFWTALMGAAIGAYVALSGAHRRIRLEGVTSERKVWREKIREMATRLYKAECDKNLLASEFALNLNPFDHDDMAIVAAVRRVAEGEIAERDRQAIIARLSLLLKHDWERSKRETAPWPLRLLRVKRRRPGD